MNPSNIFVYHIEHYSSRNPLYEFASYHRKNSDYASVGAHGKSTGVKFNFLKFPYQWKF